MEHRGKPWSKDEETYILVHCHNLSYATIANHLQRYLDLGVYPYSLTKMNFRLRACFICSSDPTNSPSKTCSNVPQAHHLIILQWSLSHKLKGTF